ncbi:MAG: N-acetylglucosamine-6-phosphate deacetylase [Thermodesulfovibrionales bacterium]
MAKDFIKDSGFIDLHTHGIGRCDTKTTNPDDILKMAELHGKAGTAAILPAIYSDTIDEMRKNMEAVRRAMEIQKARGKGQGVRIKDFRLTTNDYRLSTIMGVHLEGPFLNPLRCGALDKGSFIKPTLSSLKRLIDGYEGIIKIITIAPELSGALRVIERCRELGIRVNMGHSDATYKQALDGKKAGAAGITHIFNAMRPFHHREPGIAGFGLLDEDTYIEVIADGVHLHPETLKLIFSVKRHDRVILVSDSVKGAGRGRMPIYKARGILAGSNITVAEAADVLKKIGISDAVIKKAGMNNPERYLAVIQS